MNKNRQLAQTIINLHNALFSLGTVYSSLLLKEE